MDERGFGLVDVLVSVAVLAICGTALYSAIFTATHTTKMAGDDLTALNIARAKIEQLEAYAASASSFNNLPLMAGTTTVKQANGTYTVTVVVSPNATVQNMDNVTVTVQSGSTTLATLATTVAER